MTDSISLTEAAEIIGKINISNYDKPNWWSFNFTAKNPLSSKLISKLTDKNQLDKENVPRHFFLVLLAKLIALFRLFTLYVECLYYFRNSGKKLLPQILIFSFLDGQKELIPDPYFGNLATNIPPSKVGYVYLCYRPYSKFKRNVIGNNGVNLLSLLRMKDFIWIGKEVIKFNLEQYNIPKRFVWHVNREMINEVKTTFIYNLAVNRAFKHLDSSNTSCVLYPFENKSIEKMLLLGLVDNIKTIGYQHSSVSLRHYNFILSKREHEITPMPDKIVTCGSITKNFLVSIGNFDSNLVVEGCELRNPFQVIKRLKRNRATPVTVLLCFSSSYEEITESIKILKLKFNKNNHVKIIARFHTDFPLDGLPEFDKEWILNNLIVSYNQSLKNDLEHADIVAYATSSVAIVGLKFGIPALQIHPSSPIGDPLFEKDIPNRFYLKDMQDIIEVVREISNSPESEILAGSEYASKYFASSSNELVKVFFDGYQ